MTFLLQPEEVKIPVSKFVSHNFLWHTKTSLWSICTTRNETKEPSEPHDDSIFYLRAAIAACDDGTTVDHTASHK
jgi:hypothetical protein